MQSTFNAVVNNGYGYPYTQAVHAKPLSFGGYTQPLAQDVFVKQHSNAGNVPQITFSAERTPAQKAADQRRRDRAAQDKATKALKAARAQQGGRHPSIQHPKEKPGDAGRDRRA
ncbi:MAG: hypothetical protein VKJ04_03845 [Vampirovibrionales bacterium]|nr:hypothetical protein [Vampirovibrionales bacterium]